MVLGILTAVAACPAIIGTTEAIRYGQSQNAREEARGRKQNLTVTLLDRSFYSEKFDGAYIVLLNKKLYVDVRTFEQKENRPLHPFTGYFLPYPDMAQYFRDQGFAKGEGMVTTISRDPPFLNWVYVDRQTHEVKYGVRADSTGNRVGPWDCTKIDRRLTFEGWEGFIAVQENEGDGLWALYFDINDDGLRHGDRIGTKDKRMLAVEVWRKELRRDREAAVEERLERLQMRQETASSSNATDVS